MPLDATPGGVSANAYVDVAGAQAYFDRRLNVAAWTAADTPTKERALMAATARLEQETYVACKTAPGQALKWPRYGVEDDDTYLYSAAVVPVPVVAACCELALHLLNAGATDALAPTGLEQIAHVAIGSLDVTPSTAAPSAGALPPQVVRLLRRLRTTSASSLRVVRG